MVGEYREKSILEANAEDNILFSMWTKTWGIIVRPWYSMDKLVFDFVEKEQSGKGKSFKVCMSTIKNGGSCFDNWAYDILNGYLFKILANEKAAQEKYPKEYRYVTGKNVDKSLGICNASSGSGYCLNGSVTVDGKKVFANIPISRHDLRQLAESYQISYEARRQKLEQIRKNAAAKIAKESESRKQEKAEENKPPQVEKTKLKQLELTLSEMPEKKKDHFVFTGIEKKSGIEIPVIVTFETMRGEQKDVWTRLHSVLNNASAVTVKLSVQETEDGLVVASLL